MAFYSNNKKSKDIFDSSTTRYLNKDNAEMDFNVLNSAKVDDREDREDIKVNNVRTHGTKLIKKIIPEIFQDTDKNLLGATDYTGLLSKFEDVNYNVDNRYYMLYDHENIDNEDYTFSTYSFVDARNSQPFSSLVRYSSGDDGIDVDRQLDRQLTNFNKRLVRSSTSVIKD